MPKTPKPPVNVKFTFPNEAEADIFIDWMRDTGWTDYGHWLGEGEPHPRLIQKTPETFEVTNADPV